ncbi:MAG: SlyX family protein [Spirochaetaceae bacterium]|jgi:SlyX protein|nr:SlyX family protein [Spirochaetaceae bacterium]
MDQQDLERRLEKIETKLAFLEDFLIRLQDETLAQNAVLEKLSSEHTLIKARLLQISDELEEIPNRRPPHY